MYEDPLPQLLFYMQWTCIKHIRIGNSHAKKHIFKYSLNELHPPRFWNLQQYYIYPMPSSDDLDPLLLFSSLELPLLLLLSWTADE
jgi:hypothetical protein